jgi:hypothetical protein
MRSQANTPACGHEKQINAHWRHAQELVRHGRRHRFEMKLSGRGDFGPSGVSTTSCTTCAETPTTMILFLKKAPSRSSRARISDRKFRKAVVAHRPRRS